MRRLLPALAVLVGLVVLLAPQEAHSEDGWSGTTTAARVFVGADGTITQQDSETVSVKVSQTTNLRGRQDISVSWSGAHPTGGIVSDVNSTGGIDEEYPVVLLECRGKPQDVTPETCWTQGGEERFQGTSTPVTAVWRSDAYADAADRAAVVDAPGSVPSSCPRSTSERWLPFQAANGKTYAGGALGCAGLAPEAGSSTGLPSNTTYGVTATDGRGSARFDVWTADENASLGCSAQVACSLVVVPVVGISCDAWGTKISAPPTSTPAAADSACRAPDVYQPGDRHLAGQESNLATSGALWWAASNWRNHISVPLSFAISPSLCGLINSTAPLAVYGSPMMTETTAQWSPKFCTDSTYEPFTHVQTADSSARNLIVAGTANAAFSSRAPDNGFGSPVVEAPVELSGFAITYAIDDADGQPVTSLHLDARLVAKLLSQSYGVNPLVWSSYGTPLSTNPHNITQDPEFKQLNPGLPSYNAVEAAATLQALGSDADLTWALTSWINADPDARAWLDGQADPWGMTVNPSYRGIGLPVESWPMLDSFMLPQSYIDSGNNACYTYAPAPYLQLVANPSTNLQTINQDIQFGLSNVDIACPNGDPNDIATLKMTTQGRQTPGKRFVLGLTSLTAAARYGLATAALQTAPGRFVAGDDAGLKAGAALYAPDAATNTWTLDYGLLHTSAASAAYPGTMFVYADVPTKGLDPDIAKRAGQLLQFAVTDGQEPGLDLGQLPPGALPMTEANGLSAQAAYTEKAAAAVIAQRGEVPPVTPSAPAPGTPQPKPARHGAKPPAVATTPTVPGVTPVVAGVPPATVPAVGAGPATTAGQAVTDAEVRTVGASSRIGHLGLPAVAFLALLCAMAGLLLRFGDVLVPAAARAARAGRAASRRMVAARSVRGARRSR